MVVSYIRTLSFYLDHQSPDLLGKKRDWLYLTRCCSYCPVVVKQFWFTYLPLLEVVQQPEAAPLSGPLLGLPWDAPRWLSVCPPVLFAHILTVLLQNGAVGSWPFPFSKKERPEHGFNGCDESSDCGTFLTCEVSLCLLCALCQHQLYHISVDCWCKPEPRELEAKGGWEAKF